MRELPPTRKLHVAFGGETIPVQATLSFTYQSGETVGPARNIIVQAGRSGMWTVELTPLTTLPAGARIGWNKLENEFRFAWRHQDYWPDALDYVSVEDGDGQRLPFESDTVLKSEIPAIVTLPRSFGPEDRIVLRMGDLRFGGPGSVISTATYEGAHLVVGVQLPGGEHFRPCPDATVAVQVVAEPPLRRYYCFAPSLVKPGESFTVMALGVERNANLIQPGAAVEITAEGQRLAVRETERHALHAKATLRQPGVTRVELVDRENGLKARSNPIRVTADAEYHIYWGEFHWHGYDAYEINVLNNDSHPDKAYAYGRDITGLDFSAPGSHIFRHSPQLVHEWWELYREAARKYDEPGRYVPFMGCEWRDKETEGGDRNLIWRDLDAAAPDATWRIGEIYARFRGQPFMMTPHVGGTAALPYKHDPQVERLCEMVSGSGQSEWIAQAYLSKGYRVGMIGASDSHHANPGHPRGIGREGGQMVNTFRRRDSGYTGGPLFAVLAKSLDRESLWEAFQARRTYATTGARALLDFRANGSWMGSEITAERNVTFEIDVEGAAPIERVDLIRDQQRLRRWGGYTTSDGGETHFAAQFVDRPPDGTHYYYLRVEQQDGELIWSSPIWVESRCGGSSAELPAWNEEPPIDLAAIAENAATPYLADLWRYLEREERTEPFSQLTPLKVVHAPLGDYAVFLGYLRGHHIRIHWFYDFETPRMRIEAGWVHYGAERIRNQEWAAPLFATLDRMG